MEYVERVERLLYEAISLLVDKTLDQYDDEEEWKDMMCNELGCTREELQKYGGLMF
jgi:hypothetical protein